MEVHSFLYISKNECRNSTLVKGAKSLFNGFYNKGRTKLLERFCMCTFNTGKGSLSPRDCNGYDSMTYTKVKHYLLGTSNQAGRQAGVWMDHFDNIAS